MTSAPDTRASGPRPAQQRDDSRVLRDARAWHRTGLPIPDAAARDIADLWRHPGRRALDTLAATGAVPDTAVLLREIDGLLITAEDDSALLLAALRAHVTAHGARASVTDWRENTFGVHAVESAVLAALRRAPRFAARIAYEDLPDRFDLDQQHVTGVLLVAALDVLLRPSTPTTSGPDAIDHVLAGAGHRRVKALLAAEPRTVHLRLCPAEPSSGGPPAGHGTGAADAAVVDTGLPAPLRLPPGTGGETMMRAMAHALLRHPLQVLTRRVREHVDRVWALHVGLDLVSPHAAAAEDRTPITADLRYTVEHRPRGVDKRTQWVARFIGEIVGTGDTEHGAWDKADVHRSQHRP